MHLIMRSPVNKINSNQPNMENITFGVFWVITGCFGVPIPGGNKPFQNSPSQINEAIKISAKRTGKNMAPFCHLKTITKSTKEKMKNIFSLFPTITIQSLNVPDNLPGGLILQIFTNPNCYYIQLNFDLAR